MNQLTINNKNEHQRSNPLNKVLLTIDKGNKLTILFIRFFLLFLFDFFQFLFFFFFLKQIKLNKMIHQKI